MVKYVKILLHSMAIFVLSIKAISLLKQAYISCISPISFSGFRSSISRVFFSLSSDELDCWLLRQGQQRNLYRGFFVVPNLFFFGGKENENRKRKFAWSSCWKTERKRAIVAIHKIRLTGRGWPPKWFRGNRQRSNMQSPSMLQWASAIK